MILEITVGILLAVLIVIYWKPLAWVAFWIARFIFTLVVFGGLAFLLGN